MILARLACVRRTASVHPELGSNSFKLIFCLFWFVLNQLEYLILLLIISIILMCVFSLVVFFRSSSILLIFISLSKLFFLF